MKRELALLKGMVDKLCECIDEKQEMSQLVHAVQKEIELLTFKADRMERDKSSLLTLLNRTSEDLEEAVRQVEAEQEVSDRLLLNIFPKPIAERLKKGERTIADSFPDVTLLFVDIAEFTPLAAEMSPNELVFLLNQLFSTFDRLAKKYGLEKIKTIGDAYMVAGGLPTPRPDHAEAIAEMALDIQRIIPLFKRRGNEPLRVRIGIHTGPVVAGVIGINKFSYDLWGDTVSTASRMESHGIEGCIQVTSAAYERLKEKYQFVERGWISVKGIGEMTAYLLEGRKSPRPSHKGRLISQQV